MFIIIGIVAAIIGVVLVKHGSEMAVKYKKHSAAAYWISGRVCFIATACCAAIAFGVLTI